jgi:hypothetical protein
MSIHKVEFSGTQTPLACLVVFAGFGVWWNIPRLGRMWTHTGAPIMIPFFFFLETLYRTVQREKQKQVRAGFFFFGFD